MATGYRLIPDDWQSDWVDCTLRRRRSGRWAAATSCLAVPRQNGKNGGIEVVELFGMVALGLKFLHTAHEVKTARKAFRRLLSFFENEREFPELAAMVEEIRKTNGQEAIILKNGGSVEFVARSSGSGRGFTVDVLVCDEAQDLTDDELAALLPTISAAPSGFPLVILTGTPPDPEKAHLAKGEVFRRVRQEAIDGTDPDLCFVDFGVKDGPLPDVDDRDLWYQTNPALGTRLNVAEVVRERKLMSPETFARERLGWWGDPKANEAGTFPAGAWRACEVVECEPPDVQAIGVSVSIDQAWSSIAAAGAWDDESINLGAVDRRRGTAWLVADAKARQDRTGCKVVIDGKGPAAHLIPDFIEAGVKLTVLGTEDVLNACGQLFNAVRDEQITHMGHEELDKAVAGAQHRYVGDRWAWGRKQSTAEISMLDAATCAYAVVANPADYDPLDSFY